MTMYRIGEKRHVRNHVKDEGNEVLRLVGTAGYTELTEGRPEPNEWVAFSLVDDCEEVAMGVRKAIGLAKGA